MITEFAWHPLCYPIRYNLERHENLHQIIHMKHRSKIILAAFSVALLACAAFAPQTHAVQVTGAINFAGSVQLNSPTAATATQVTAWSGLGQPGNLPQVQNSSGSFAIFAPAGTNATFFAPWNFNSGMIVNFWQAGGFTFTLTSSMILTQGVGPGGLGFVTVGGMGIISGNGFDPTSGTWSFSTQDPSAGVPPEFSFSAGTNSIAPDGGTTVALLGLALVGVEALRRKLKIA